MFLLQIKKISYFKLCVFKVLFSGVNFYNQKSGQRNRINIKKVFVQHSNALHYSDLISNTININYKYKDTIMTVTLIV